MIQVTVHVQHDKGQTIQYSDYCDIRLCGQKTENKNEQKGT